MTTTATRPSKPKGALIAALVCLLLGIAGCGFAASKVVPFASDLVEFISDLDQFARVVPMGEETTFSSNGSKGVALLSSESVCTGEGPSGAVSFQGYEAFGSTTDVDLNGVDIQGYVLFDTESGSEYTIRCGDSSSDGSYMATTAPSFIVEGAPGVAQGIGAAVAGAFFVFLALILLIVGLVQRSSWKKKQNQFRAAPVGPSGHQAAPYAPGPPQGGGWPQQGPSQSPWGTPPPTPGPSQQPPPPPGPSQQPPSPPAPGPSQQPPSPPAPGPSQSPWGTPPPAPGPSQQPPPPPGDSPPPPPPPPDR